MPPDWVTAVVTLITHTDLTTTGTGVYTEVSPQPGDHRYLVLAQAPGLYILTVLLRSFHVLTRLFVLCECLWGNQFPYELWKLIPTGL